MKKKQITQTTSLQSKQNLHLKNSTPPGVIFWWSLNTTLTSLFIYYWIGDTIEILLSSHVFDNLEEPLADTISFVVVEVFQVAVFGDIHSLDIAIVVHTHYDAIFILVVIPVVDICSDIRW